MATKHDNSATNLGFWLYLMTDLMVFASLFATFVVLRHATAGGVGMSDIIDMKLVLAETMILLASSLFCGLAWLAMKYNKKKDMYVYLVFTLIAGLAFLSIELYEFFKLIAEGHDWQNSAMLSAYFTLVGTHGFHILIGLLWGASLILVLSRRGLNQHTIRKFGLFSVFWHFLDIVWIFIFTIVYIIGGYV